MFRLASFLGIACLALAACALGRVTPRVRQAASEDNPEIDPHRLHARLVRQPGKGYHARFSLN
jgi:hypothetical protein